MNKKEEDKNKKRVVQNHENKLKKGAGQDGLKNEVRKIVDKTCTNKSTKRNE
ncbi:hypothetical protein P4T62_28450 [Bacillus mycoides]|uniref:hypothetical protein n=1 Tax=Bacillus mycoides TaxID=1405 RepID=UPI002E241069|nr:hypothetical protein [Bacillus mycoides]